MKSIIVFLSLLIAGHWAAGQVLLNGDFEILEGDPLHPTPANWSIENVGGELSNDAHDGHNALRVWNWYVWVAGTAAYKQGPNESEMLGMAITLPPQVLSGFYKYDLGLNGDAQDSAVCQMLLYKSGSAGVDTIAYVEHLFGPSKRYKTFVVEFPKVHQDCAGAYLSIRFLSGKHGNCGEGSKGNCLYFTVDDLELTFAPEAKPEGWIEEIDGQ